jgi:inosine-uridine nucleoside N-ribohydrolase
MGSFVYRLEAPSDVRQPWLPSLDSPALLSSSACCPPGLQFHGKDGLGDVPDAQPACAGIQLQPRPGHAAVHLAAAAREHGAELTVVATGPLTNIALACKIDEHFAQKGTQGSCR